jgi:large subunit ribosomal protein L23
MRSAREIIRRPVITEKSTIVKDAHGILCFEVATDANKIEVKRAIQDIFGVKVQSVKMANILGKVKRVGRNVGGRPNWKKAYVKLAEGEKTVEYFEGA